MDNLPLSVVYDLILKIVNNTSAVYTMQNNNILFYSKRITYCQLKIIV